MATNTYVALQTTTVSTPVSSITFSSIPQGYTDLVVVCNYASSNGLSFLYAILNSDTGSNYSVTDLYANGYGVGSSRASNLSINWLAYNVGCSSTVGDTITTINLMNYSNSNTYKTYLSQTRRANSTGAANYYGVDTQVNLWRNTSAITSLTLKNNTSGVDYNFAAGSTFTLYGVANADNFTKATGGIISEDSTYTYHVFGSSGTFTPKQALTADILVVAGGGGSGSSRGAGGGAGGLLGFTSQSLTATGYTVTVGGGGAGGASGSGNRGTNGGDSQFGALTLVKGGGGGAGAAQSTGSNGGSGGGTITTNGYGLATSGQGYNGGNGGSYLSGSGGGGAGAAGGDATGDTAPGSGGVGVSTYSSWGLATSTGHNVNGTVYYAGGGGGGKNGVGGTTSTGGYGGGGAGTNTADGLGATGLAYTGGGGGAGTNTTIGVAGSAGGSGVVIIRYLK